MTSTYWFISGSWNSAIATNEDVLRIHPVELVICGDVVGGDVLGDKAEDPLAGIATARLHLLEQEREGALRVVGLSGDGNAEAGVEWIVEAELGVDSFLNAHQRRANQPDDRPLVPLDNDIGDLEVSEDAENVWRSIANSHGVGGVGTNGDPYNDGAESLTLVLNSREARRLERGVLDVVGLHRRKDPGGQHHPTRR